LNGSSVLVFDNIYTFSLTVRC